MANSDQDKNLETKPVKASWLKYAVWGGFIVAALLTAYLTYVAVRDLVASWEMTSLPGVTIQDATPTPGGEGEVVRDPSLPTQPAGAPTPPPWDGANRVSLLVMGLDYRDWAAGEGPPRTDTMILFTIDPINRTAGILSIPRDLWVNIPGFDYGRINSAYQLGEAYTVVGGGPQLATDTVEELLGVPIDYYAQVDFGAFVRFIDEIGGVKLDVPEKIKIDPLGDNTSKTLKPGIQTLPGDLALAYVRARKTEGGDFDRAQRQQQVILAIRNRILEFDMLPHLISKAPVLYEELSAGLRTNLSLDLAIRLAWLAVQIPSDKIKQGSIGSDQVSFATSPDGQQDVLKPITEKIRLLRDEIFTESGPASPMALDLDVTEQLAAENARIIVLNGSSTAGLAASTADYLKSLGFNYVETGNAENFATYTEITFYTGKPYTVKYLVEMMNISEFRIKHVLDPTRGADIVIILGDDWALSNPMP
jgi:LCP family protein required for cell wall assembly